jgi:hypothetical protein
MGTRKGETDILQGFHVKLTPMKLLLYPTFRIKQSSRFEYMYDLHSEAQGINSLAVMLS